jgi:hypothetical protein
MLHFLFLRSEWRSPDLVAFLTAIWSLVLVETLSAGFYGAIVHPLLRYAERTLRRTS